MHNKQMPFLCHIARIMSLLLQRRIISVKQHKLAILNYINITKADKWSK